MNKFLAIVNLILDFVIWLRDKCRKGEGSNGK